MRDLRQRIWPLIAVAGGRNLLENVKPELHRSQPLFVALTERLSPPSQLAARLNDSAANLDASMLHQLLPLQHD
jgi:hypothetical protein